MWTRTGLPFQLKLETKNGASYKFDGFREADVEALKKYISKGYGVSWKEDAVSHRGWNWGVVDVDGTTLKFTVDSQPSFELPLNEATSANMTKTEVSVSFNPSGEAIEDGDALAEIKFFVPNTRGDEPEAVKDHVAGAEEEDEVPDFNEELLMTPAEALANKIMDKIEGACTPPTTNSEGRFPDSFHLFSPRHMLTFSSSHHFQSLSFSSSNRQSSLDLGKRVFFCPQVLPANAQPIVVFERTSMSTPRGQIDLQLHPNFFFLAGKNFRIDYSHIVRIFLVPQTRDDMSSLVISLDPPIRQGSTSYPLIVFSIPNKEVEVTLNQDGIPEGSALLELGASVSGALDEVTAKVLGTLADKKVTRTSTTGFKSTADEASVACKYRQADGLVYPLEQSFVVIVPKTPIHVPFSDIAFVNFEVISQFFTMELHLKSGTIHALMVIPVSQHQVLYNFCKSKNIKTEGEQPATYETTSTRPSSRSKRATALASRSATRQQIQRTSGHDEDDDEDDGEFQAGNEEDEEDEEDDDFNGEAGEGDDGDDDDDGEDGEEEEVEEKPVKKNKKRAAPTQASDDEDGEVASKKSKPSADDE